MGDSTASFVLGKIYLQGEKGVKEDINKAIESLERGSMQGDPISTRKLATIYEKGIKKKNKAEYFEKCGLLQIGTQNGRSLFIQTTRNHL